ncbi:ABC transporter permease [Vagococcus fluvialis]|uniref:ABC transporter permease n=1 Tax=Vagococcus fluvialis TaxID=2738 RepID=UPI001A8D305F|nr:ABC transporter permease [Vagococcus fluvialis]MBO0428322.1 ABC transporter permease [Vagococcus fluvialis]
MNKKVINAIFIRTKNLLQSPVIKINFLICFILSLFVTFWPYISNHWIESKATINTNIQDSVLNEEFTISNSKDSDIFIKEIDGKYEISVNTQKGYSKIDYLSQILVSKILIKNQIEPIIIDNFIEIKLSDSINQKQEKYHTTFIFLMMLSFLSMIILITRVAGQVAYEKGTKLTEIILTSITKKQLYFSNVVSGIILIIICLVIVILPIWISNGMNIDNKYVTDFSFITTGKALLSLGHMFITNCIILPLTIAVSSLVKRTEDANLLSIFSFLPLTISYFFALTVSGLYLGKLYFLNYVPLVSAYQVFQDILFDSTLNSSVYIFEVVCFIIVYFVGQIIFEKKIQTR